LLPARRPGRGYRYTGPPLIQSGDLGPESHAAFSGAVRSGQRTWLDTPVGTLCSSGLAGVCAQFASSATERHIVSASALMRAATAGKRRSLSRQRLRLGPILPIEIPSLALIAAYGSGGSSRNSGWLQAGQTRPQKQVFYDGPSPAHSGCGGLWVSAVGGCHLAGTTAGAAMSPDRLPDRCLDLDPGRIVLGLKMADEQRVSAG